MIPKYRLNKRIQSLEAVYSNKTRNVCDSLDYHQKKEILRKFYAKLYGINHLLTKEEYKNDLLKRFPEVLEMSTAPSMPAGSDSLTTKEKLSRIILHFQHEAWFVAFGRYLLPHQRNIH